MATASTAASTARAVLAGVVAVLGGGVVEADELHRAGQMARVVPVAGGGGSRMKAGSAGERRVGAGWPVGIEEVGVPVGFRAGWVGAGLAGCRPPLPAPGP